MVARNNCVGSSPAFNPSAAICDDKTHKRALRALENDNDLDTAIRTWFHIPKDDGYVYHAIASITLAQMQAMIRLGGKNGLHNWYEGCRDEKGEKLPPPTTADINAYISIFLPTTSTPAALRSFASNARKSSIRALVSANLTSRRHLSPSLASLSIVPKTTCAPLNPYFSFWSYTCNTLAWCGPTPFPNLTPHKSHPILPILMHHFACAVPSHESLTLLTRLATGRTIVDIGSGTGYWTFMLRQYGATCVAIDNGQSAWRTMWVDDTVPAEGTQWLGRHENRGGEDMLVLVVYPIVGGGLAGGTEGGFMRGLMRACNANTIAVVGTQNRNGYTAFRDMTVDEFMEKEHGNCWEKAVQVPLPSFAGKDEALFVFQKRECLFAP